jgi:hypothetical protein
MSMLPSYVFGSCASEKGMSARLNNMTIEAYRNASGVFKCSGAQDAMKISILVARNINTMCRDSDVTLLVLAFFFY